MKAALLIGLCFFGSLKVSAQTAYTSLPNWLIDSMAFEVKLGRQCNELQKAQAEQIQKLGLELIATGKLLEASESKNKVSEDMLQNSKESKDVLTQQFNLDRKELRRKIRKRNAVILGETLALIGLILLL